MKNKNLLCPLCLALLLLGASCNSNDSFPPDKVPMPDVSPALEAPSFLYQNNPSSNNSSTDNGYKLFYGSWVVGDMVYLGPRLSFDSRDIEGKEYYFSKEKCIYYFDGETIEVNSPKYEMAILPLEEVLQYYPEPLAPSLDQFGIEGSYVVIFNVQGESIIEYIVKDDNTLIMLYRDAFIELTRTEHIPNYEVHYFAT